MNALRQCLVIILEILFLSSCQNEIKEDLSPVVSESYSDVWKFHAGEGTDSLWMNADYNDAFWQEVVSSRLLKDQNISLENGFGWYRKTIQLGDSLRNAIERSGAAILHLGRFAACDEVYVNGTLVGKTGRFPHDYMGYFDNERNYLVYEKDLNLPGDNLIAIKFHDGWSAAGGFLDSAKLTVSSANTNDKLKLDAIVADSYYIFMGENPIKITVDLQNNNRWDLDGQLFVTLTTDDFQPVTTDSINIKLEANKIYSKDFTYTNPAPGFYRYTIQFKRNGETVCEKKFNVGYEPEKIQSPIDAKADFKEFWDNNLKELAKIVPGYKLTPILEASKVDYDMYLVEMKSFGNETIKGYYAKPKREGKHPVIVEYMGYGSQPYYPNQWWDGFAYFVLSIRGQALNQPTNKYGTWITYGLDNKDNYYYRGAFLDVVRALDFVSSRPEIDAERIAVRGGSQGGALSFVAAALDKRVKVAAPNIPFLSDYPDYFKIAHWPKSDFDNYIQNHPEAKWDDLYNLLTYFDIKNLAQWIECPLIMGIGVQDEVCPPHINFAAYNQVKSEKSWMAFPEFGHSVGKEFNDAAMALFRKKLNIK
ncbi:cephalosporin-C deacetylase-like acetyl esterase [Dysgonomonas hofstadii]|uniref:Cephalosporin-C deacetylase-like acetyl esterase n=1 Tax=Dysgonomonas hofstadii TaxID=637886 RepID=A0A840CEE2_9BACT|nr:acetylxylan esterase [Dysgonomonas hofstadii]MBB4034310.1 cephalosporin-C deacetylase-like acetyl esterase [Dysgonomonas hofstadii]